MKAAFPLNLQRITLRWNWLERRVTIQTGKKSFKFKEENFAYPPCNTKTVRKTGVGSALKQRIIPDDMTFSAR